MLKKAEKLHPGINEDELFLQLSGGNSVREPEEVVPAPESILKVATETMKLVEALCDARGFDYCCIWDRLVFVVQGVDLEIERVNPDDDLEDFEVNNDCFVALHNQAKLMNVPIEDLINSSVIKLESLLHLVDNQEYAATQQLDKTIRGIRPQIKASIEWLESYSFYSLSNHFRQAEDALYEAQKVIDSYLFKHASPPKALEIPRSGALKNNILGVIHEQ